MKDIKEYRSVESIYEELDALNQQMVNDIKQIFKERGITTLRVFTDDEGRNLSDDDFDADQAYDNSPLLYLNYFDGDGYPAIGLIYEVSLFNDRRISICLYNEEFDTYENDVPLMTKDVLDVYDAVISAVMRNEIK